MPGQEQVSLGEIMRRLDRFEESTRTSFKAIDDRLANNLVSRDWYLARSEALTDRVKDLEETAERSTGYRWALFAGVVVALISSAGSIVASLLR